MKSVGRNRIALSAAGLQKFISGLFQGRCQESFDGDGLESRTDRLLVSDARGMLKAMPVRVAPDELRTRLQVIASRESQRRRTRLTWSARLEDWRSDWRVRSSNLLRPFAIPTAGGLLSALLMFGVLGPTLAVPGTVARANDIPIGLYTEASVKTFMPLSFEEEELIVEITIDGNGRVVDYSLPSARGRMASEQMRRRIEYHLILTEFTPATSFGRPTSGKLRLSYRSSRIDVKG